MKIKLILLSLLSIAGYVFTCDSEMKCIMANSGDANFRCVSTELKATTGQCLWEYNAKSAPKNCVPNTLKTMWKIRARSGDVQVTVCQNKNRNNELKKLISQTTQIYLK